MAEEPEAKRRRAFSKRETLEILEKCEDNFSKAADVIISDLSPFDVTDEDETAIDNRLERLDKVATSLKNKIYRLKQDAKARKFKKKPEVLEEDLVTCSQYSVLQSEAGDDLSECFSQQSLEEESCGRPSTYKKQPLNKPMNQRSRRRRVEWAEEERVSVSVLLGYFLYLENWNGGERSLAAVGWKMFMEETLHDKPTVSLNEAVWNESNSVFRVET